MSALFYYRHLLGDYASKTKELSALEHGVYRLLMDAYYAKQGPISAAPADLYRCAVAFTPEEQAAVTKIVALYFTEADGKLHHAKCDEEIARVLKESQRQSKISRARWTDKGAGSAPADPTGYAADDPTGHAGGTPAAGAAAIPVNSHSQSKAKSPPKPPTGGSPNLLPEWLPTVEWDAYLAMRKHKGAPATDKAIRQAIGRLEALRMQGHAPALVLAQSVRELWTGVFPLKHQRPGRRAHTEAQNEATAAAWADGQ